ncbi:MAG TPA: hypothetical protein VE999_13855 [Gemmataceae bacterium]|nr:hypothetical protein [Gemmataceae bacterium]
MLTPLCVSLLGGALLGLRFKVLILVPALLILAALTTVTGLIQSDGVAWSGLTFLASAVLLETGYLGGLCVRQFFQPALSKEDAAQPGPHKSGLLPFIK